MPAPKFKLHEITQFLDPALPAWFDLYEQEFPPVERVRTSFLLRILRARQSGQPAEGNLFAALDPHGKLIGMAQTAWFEGEATLFLGYLAVDPAARGQGTGSALYRELAQVAAPRPPELILWDVERADRQPTETLAQQARRRIRFYERLGAQVIPGWSVAWDGYEGWMMAQRLADLSDDEVLWRARRIFEGEYQAEIRSED